MYYYTVNVSLLGRHYFATAKRSLTEEKKANEVFTALILRFPAAEGFKVTMTRWSETGTECPPPVASPQAIR